MTFLVPFDGSDLAEMALVRAVEFSQVLEERVLAVSVIPKGDVEYARERGWLGPEECFELSDVVARLHERAADLAPEADFEHVTVDRFAPSGTIAREIRRVGRDVDASIVFIGSENAGDLVSAVGSVGASVAAEDAYDVHIVRTKEPSAVRKLRETSPHRQEKSDFYLGGGH